MLNVLKPKIVETLSLGYTTAEVARLFRIFPARVSQLRREFYESWNQFTSGLPSPFSLPLMGAAYKPTLAEGDMSATQVVCQTS